MERGGNANPATSFGKRNHNAFINTLKALFINHMLGMMSDEMTKNAVRSDKLDAEKNSKKSASMKKENKVNNISTYNTGYSKPITVGPTRTVTTSHQSSPRQESNPRSYTERLQFTPILMTYKKLYQSLFDANMVYPFYLKPMQTPFPKWYDVNAQCEYHAGIMRHSIENCIAFKKLIERFIKMRIVKFDDPSGPNMIGNLLPNHSDKGVNAIIENERKQTKMDVA
ncbi:hypothetical protein EPI10_022650 [Gossypium australe]|uniref:Uncharacterized protein n=1 Tax=Gossypium australe TaxID=47621 RepID=A0A5B6VT22_9ROSI|nr:hypothetical protein EPI10_022650 [Gossypium australe]